MKKYFIIEMAISMIYCAIYTKYWEGVAGYIGAVIGALIIPLIPGYIIAVCITRKSPRIHKIACIVFCVLIFIIVSRQIYEGIVYG